MVEVIPGVYVERAFSAEEAAAAVAAASAAPGWREAGINADLAVDRSIRDAEVLYEDAHPELIGWCRERLFAATSRIATGLAPRTVLAELQIVRYRTGGRYVEHRDTPAPGETPRALSVVCYLNDDFSGGATAFPEREFAFQPWCGMTVIFPPAMLHRAEPVLAGTKYAITAWYHVPPVRRTLSAEVAVEHHPRAAVLREEYAGRQNS
jgi:predicted 2-oxoglutarate/Fe(II)-dependent dioxygenase YbiX